jgi:hypothetical protein
VFSIDVWSFLTALQKQKQKELSIIFFFFFKKKNDDFRLPIRSVLKCWVSLGSYSNYVLQIILWINTRVPMHFLDLRFVCLCGFIFSEWSSVFDQITIHCIQYRCRPFATQYRCRPFASVQNLHELQFCSVLSEVQFWVKFGSE